MSDKFNDIIEKVEKLTILELSELVKTMEEKFGVSAAMPVAVAAAAGGDGGAEAKSSYNVELKSAGEQKIQVIKALREVLGLGLVEAKALADSAPKVVKEGLSQKEAEDFKAKLEAAGAVVELK
ncbi:MAG: 50S ribosomal protein L7/L12 [Patescibacteria group bacterium]